MSDHHAISDIYRFVEVVAQRSFVKKVFLEISHYSQENTCAFFIKREILTQVFSCEFCEISQKTFFAEHLWAIASDQYYEASTLSLTLVEVVQLNQKPNVSNFYLLTTVY